MGDADAVGSLLRTGDVNANSVMVDHLSLTPLMWGAAFGQLSACVELVMAGADPFSVNDEVAGVVMCVLACGRGSQCASAHLSLLVILLFIVWNA